MEFRLIAGRNHNALTLEVQAGFESASRDWRSGSIAWYHPVRADGSVHSVESERTLVLYIGEAIAADDLKLAPDGLVGDGEALLGLKKQAQSICAALTGVFVLVVVDKASGTVIISGDSLGVRPWYWRCEKGALVASCTKQGLRRVMSVSHDVVGVLQITVAGYCIGARTTMQGVRRNLPNSVLEYNPAVGVASLTATKPPDVAFGANIDERAEELRGVFRGAVTDRLKHDRWGTAFLSGGLDSRMVVSSLVERGAPPVVYSLTHQRSLDVHLAKAFAESASITFRGLAFHPARRILWAGRLRKAMEHFGQSLSFSPTGYAWSGDGGSVCAGGVNVSEELTHEIRRFSTSDPKRLLDRLGFAIPSALMSRRNFIDIQRTMLEDLTGEVVRLRQAHENPGSYDFLVANDQRQHLDLHFEHWREHCTNFFLPFYDRDVLALLRSTPESMLEKHNLYARWLSLMPLFVTGTPWQTYPGHIPCPLPKPELAEHQFGDNASARMNVRIAAEFRRNLRSWIAGGLPGWLGISNAKALIVGSLHAVGVRKSEFSATVLNDLIDPHGFGGLEIDR